MQAGAWFGDKVYDDRQEDRELECLDVFRRRTCGLVNRCCDGVCQAGDGEFGGMQVVGMILEYLDDGGSMKGDLLAYVRTTMMGDGGQSPEGEVTGIVMFDEGKDLCQQTCLEWSMAYR